MNEALWNRGTNADAMLEAIRDRLTPRKWTLLACGITRQVWELLPDGPFRRMIRLREETATLTPPRDDVDEALLELADALPTAVRTAETRQRAIVWTCDPDADRSEFQESEARRVHPAVPLFRAASESAQRSIEQAAQAVVSASNAVRLLYAEDWPLGVNLIRASVATALNFKLQAGQLAAMALEYKAFGDELADRSPVKNRRLQQAEAEETVRRLAERFAIREENRIQQRSRAFRLFLAGLLRDQLGNPFREYLFSPRWRTAEVLGLARSIEEDSATERYPILLDALLDAGCDDESILGHVRGVVHPNADVPHTHGCWVIDRILQRDEPLYSCPPLEGSSGDVGPGVRIGLAVDMPT